MTYSIYAAKFEDHEWDNGDGTIQMVKLAVPVLDLEGMEHLKLHPDAEMLSEEGMNPFVSNERFLPGTGMQMSGGNICEMLRILGAGRCLEDLETANFEELRQKCVRQLTAGVGDTYMTERIIQLLNVCDVAISRNADRICVV